jgi:hypothetical protein
MRRFALLTAVFAVALSLAGVAWATSNLNLSKSNINRVGGAIVMSGSATLSGPRETQVVLNVPETGDFLLTQVCVSPTNGGIRLEARNLGPLVHVADPLCVSLQPGISVRPGSVLTCSTTGFAAAGGDYFCTVSGLFAR